MLYYSIQNFLGGADATITVSSEDALYTLENLYNERPSKPFRFTGLGLPGDPEFICVEFDDPKRVTLAAIFNHNLTALEESADALYLKGCDTGCESSGGGGCDWTIPDYALDLAPSLVEDWNDLYSFLDQTRLAYRLEIIDGGNEDAYIEIGDFFLGQYTAMANAKLQPGRTEEPRLYRAANKTLYGQHWTQAYSQNLNLSLVLHNLGDPDTVDAARLMVEAIHQNGGRAVLIPNEKHPFVYYAHLENEEGFMSQFSRGLTCEITTWTLNFQTLTKGIRLL